MGWKETDERLIRRGELILDIESLRPQTRAQKDEQGQKRT